MKRSIFFRFHIKRILFILLATFTFVACSDDDTPIRPEDIALDLHAEDFGEEVLITTVRNTSKVRSAIADTNDGSLAMIWSNADKIRLFIDNHPYTYKPLVQADSSTVVFVSDDTIKVKNLEGQKVYAVFCYNLDDLTIENGIISSSHSLGNVRDIKKSGSGWTYMYAVGTISEGELKLDFRHMFAYVKVSVTASLLKDYDYIILYSMNTIINPLSFNYDLDNGIFTKECIDEGSNNIFACVDSITADSKGVKEFYIPVLPSDGTSALVVAGYKESTNKWNYGGTTKTVKDLYMCDEPEEGMKAGEIFTMNTQTGVTTSKDYSNDGKIKTLEKATKGDGISLVFMGEGFTDKDISNGKYERIMKREMERFFSVEPYKSFRPYFTSYMVYRVAKNNDMLQYSEIDEEEDWNSAMAYTEKVLSFQNADTVGRAIVVYNSNYVGRSATLFSAYGHFASFIMENYPTVTIHEAGGHGFSFLSDEYVEQGYEMRRLPESEKETIRFYHENYNGFMNIDYDSQNPIWAKFIGDERYSTENLGAYTGGFTYGRGVYRPTEQSIMNDHTESSSFNAPSREAIYRHIMMYADSCYTYNDADFYAYDVINMQGASAARNRNTDKIENSSQIYTRNTSQHGIAPKLKKDFSMRTFSNK